MSGAAGDAGRHMQHPVAEGVDLAAGQLGGVGEPDQLGPGDQVSGSQHDLQPGGVGLKIMAGQVSLPGRK